MAQYTITHTCGHTSVAKLFGKHDGRDRRITALSAEDCSACRAGAAKATAEVAGLPALTGSEKQIAWATDIRAEQIAQLDTTMADVRARTVATAPAWATTAIETAAEATRRQVTASWWIDNRHRRYDLSWVRVVLSDAKPQ